jgi:hypothetical protein
MACSSRPKQGLNLELPRHERIYDKSRKALGVSMGFGTRVADDKPEELGWIGIHFNSLVHLLSSDCV